MTCYVKSTLQLSPLLFLNIVCDTNFELLWINLELHSHTFIYCSIYHPPSPTYDTTLLIQYLSDCLDYIYSTFTRCIVAIGGDINQLPNEALCNLRPLQVVSWPLS